MSTITGEGVEVGTHSSDDHDRQEVTSNLQPQFAVMLEGVEEGQRCFFITYIVAAPSISAAMEMALEKARATGLDIVSCEDVDELEPGSHGESLCGIVKVLGKSYFDPGESS